MVKLYLRENGRITRYREAWVHGSKVVQHWGPLGQRGASLRNPRDKELSDDHNIAKVLDPWRAEGYAPLDPADQWILEIIYRVNGMGTPDDLKKRHAVQDRMNELLGWTGLGHCDGGSIGSGTMEVACIVVDSELAERVIAESLRNTAFSDYTQIRAQARGERET